MTPNNNVSVLPFYKSLQEQDHRKSYSHGVSKPVFSSTHSLPPFQIIRDHNASTPDPIISSCQLVNLETSATIDIRDEIILAGLNIVKFASKGYDVIKYPSKLIFPNTVVSPGTYYVVLNDGFTTWYSDLIEVVRDLSQYLKVEFWDIGNIEFYNGEIDYSGGFRNFQYFDSELNRPEYEIKEEVKDRDGYMFYEKQVSEKVYKFSFFAPEYTCDILRLLRMHDKVNIYDNRHGYEQKYEIDSIVVEPKWQKQSNIAEVNVEFHCDTVVKKVGKGITGFETSGDFNNDYNSDFDN